MPIATASTSSAGSLAGGSAASADAASSTNFGFDAERLDARLTQARNVQGAWSLPALPDVVMLDLASSSHIQNMGGFLSGLSADVEAAGRPEPLDLEYAPEIPQEDPQLARFRQLLRPSGAANAYRVADEIVSPFDPPELPSSRGVEAFKLEAIERGYLQSGTPIDGRWSPELNQIRNEMGYDSFRETIAGNRAGAVPVDDVVLPALNLGLLMSGVGGVNLAAQWAYRGARTAEAAECRPERR